MRRSRLRLFALVLVVLLAAGAGYWAGQQFDSADDDNEIEPSEPLTTTTRTGTLGEEYPAPISLEWTQNLALPFLGETGVVTALRSDSGSFSSVESGAVIGTVNGTPVVVLEGEQPAHRRMEVGITGIDVAQLQAFLVLAGFLMANDADGTFGEATAQAVQDWWETLGVEDRNTVPIGSVIFASDLPRLLSTDQSVRVGQFITTGAPFLVGVSSTPVASVTLTDIQEQRFLVEGAKFYASDPNGAEVEMTVLASQIRDGTNNIELGLPADVFDRWSFLISAPGTPARLRGRMVVTPPVEGTIVALAALNNLTDSNATVRLASGDEVVVKVVAVVGGQAIVEPIDPGEVVVINP